MDVKTVDCLCRSTTVLQSQWSGPEDRFRSTQLNRLGSGLARPDPFGHSWDRSVACVEINKIGVLSTLESIFF